MLKNDQTEFGNQEFNKSRRKKEILSFNFEFS